MKVCSKCGMLNVDTASFCLECGTALGSGNAEDNFFSQSDKTTVINRDENINGYVDGEEKTTIIDPLDDNMFGNDTNETSSTGLKLNLGNDPEPVSFKNADNTAQTNQGGYAGAGYNSFANNNSQPGQSYGAGSVNSGSPYNSNPMNGGPSYNDYPSNDITYMSAPNNNNGRNLVILAALGVVLVLVAFLVLGGGKKSIKVTNTPKQAVSAFLDDIEDFELNNIPDYGVKEFFVEDFAGMAELESFKAEVDKYPGMTIDYELMAVEREEEVDSAKKRALKAALRSYGHKGKIGDTKYIYTNVRVTVRYGGRSQDNTGTFRVLVAQYDGKWRVFEVDER